MAHVGLKRKLSAILSADVKGYSRLMGEDEEGTVRTLIAYRDILTGLIRQYRGRVVDSPGDNLLSEFASVVDAVQCAVEIQQVLRARNTALPENRRMEFRIGVNLGDVIEEGDRIYGDGVNIAARLESMADGGGICISGSAYDQIKNKLALGYDYLGEHEVKNIAEPVRVYKTQVEPAAKNTKSALISLKSIALTIILILVMGTGIYFAWNRYFRPSVEPASVDNMAYALPDKPSIAVLPFNNMSGDPEQEYFADGITEDLITDLSQMPGLFVIARNSTFFYKGKPVKIRQVAEDLGVRYVLEGSVRKAVNEVRINAQLIDATTGHHVWAKRFDGKLDNIFALQDNITQKIVSALAIKLTPKEAVHKVSRHSDNIEAYDSFLKGWEYYLRFTPDDLVKACVHFEKAIDLDPTYSRAYAALALSIWNGFRQGTKWISKITKHQFERMISTRRPGLHDTKIFMNTLLRIFAREYLDIAMKIPSSLSHQVSSSMALYNRQYEKAISEARRAIEMDPNNSNAHLTLAEALIFSGKHNEAISILATAKRLDPRGLSSPLYLHGLSKFSTGELSEAVTLLERALAHNPHLLGYVSATLGATYGLLGDKKNADRFFYMFFDTFTRFPMQEVLYFWPFRDRKVVDRLVDGLQKLGIKDRGLGVYRITEENRLTGEELRSRSSGKMVIINLFRSLTFTIKYTKDGKATIDTIYEGVDTGRRWISGDNVCFQWEKAYFGLKYCGPVFRNSTGTRKKKDEFIWINDFGFQPFSYTD